MRRLRGGERPAGRPDARRRHPPPPERGRGARLVPAPEPPLGRRPHRAPHLHRQPHPRGRRAHEQLDVPGRGAPARGAPLRGRDEGADALRRALRHGPARLARKPRRGRGHGQPVRGREHAAHDAHGPGRARRSSAPRRSSCPGSTRSGTSRPSGASSSTFPRSARSGAWAPATGATPSWARSASRCGSPRPWRATRAGWPSTCSSSSSSCRTGRSTTSARPSPPPAARRTWPCSSRRSRTAGSGCARWATTSPGCGRDPTAGSGR